MAKFLGVDISGIVAKQFKGKTLTATLEVRTPGTRDANDLAGGSKPTSVNKTAEGFIEEFQDHEINGTSIKKSDRKVLLFGDLIEDLAVPKPKDRIVIDGTTYTIQGDGVERDPAKATYICHCRSI